MKKNVRKRFSFKNIENELTHEWNKKIFLNLKGQETKNLSVL